MCRIRRCPTRSRRCRRGSSRRVLRPITCSGSKSPMSSSTRDAILCSASIICTMRNAVRPDLRRCNRLDRERQTNAIIRSFPEHRAMRGNPQKCVGRRNSRLRPCTPRSYRPEHGANFRKSLGHDCARMAGGGGQQADAALRRAGAAQHCRARSARGRPAEPPFAELSQVAYHRSIRRAVGPTAQQMTTVASWLTSQGFTVTSTNQRTRRVGFTGTVATVRQAFGTSILTDGSGSYVNTSDPMVPAQIAPTIQAIIGLTKMPTPSSSESQGRKIGRARKGTSLFNDAIVNGQGPNFAPSDLYLFYDETSVLNAGNKGTGAPDCVGLPEQGDVTDSALADFTGQFNLPPVTLKKFLVNGSNPGLPSDNEPALDVEWVHAVSPNTPI